MRGVFLTLALLVPGCLPAQLVRGHVLEAGGGAPIARAVVELRHLSGQVVTRGVTGPTGAYAVFASTAGHYTLRIAAIGYTPHSVPAFDLPAAGLTLESIRLSPVAVTLTDLQVLGTSRCGADGAGSPILTRLLDGARTSLDVMSGSLAASDGGFRVQLVRRRSIAMRRDSTITADTSRAAMLRWPIESIDPDSIRRVGFMVPGLVNGTDGHLWYGPDVRVLFSDWFLEAHCFRVEPRAADTTAITVVFDPVVRRGRVDIAGTMVLDPVTLALRRLTFEHRNLQRPLRNGMAGGELRFAELPSGIWLPLTWRIFAPIVGDRTGAAIGTDEYSGRVLTGEGGPGREPRRVALHFRVPRDHLAPPDSPTDVRHYTAAIGAACPHATPRDRDALLAHERRLAEVAADSNSAADNWHALACVRALLDANEAIGREGLLMPLGTGWQDGATSAWLRALERDSMHLGAAEGLAVLALDQAFPKQADAVRAALTRAVSAGIAAPAAVRGCALLTIRAKELEASNRCVLVGLAGGGDSTWQLLHLTRLASRGADTLMVSTLMESALKSAHDTPAWSEVGWHLRWFTEPEEWWEWNTLADSVRPIWVRDRLASRDVRDGRRPGARLVEHFRRLDYAEANYMRDVPDHLRGFSALAATHDRIAPPEDPDKIRFTSAPESVHAEPFRAFVPAVEWLDDRGVIYLRFGAPVKHAIWIDTAGASALVRESWLYQIDAARVLVHFESEAHDGSSGASRLVPGVLGHYLCSLDNVRCQLTNRLACWDLPGGCASPPISAERLATLRTEDRADLRIATTRDDNSPRSTHAIHTVAQFSRVWDPRSGAPLAVIPYAFRLGDVERDADSTVVTATLNIELRQWSGISGSWTSTDFQRRLRLAGRLRDDAHLTGYSVVPSGRDVTAWSLFAVQGSDRSGRAWGDRLTPLASGSLAMSDLVLGAEGQGQTWSTTGGMRVPLGPLGAFDKEQPVSLYWQVRSTTPRDPVRISIALFRAGPRDSEAAVLEVGFDGQLTAGLNELQRNLGVAHLDGGTYRVEVTVRDGEESAVRSGRLLLR